MSVWFHFCFIWKIIECSFGYLTTFLLEKVPSGVKNATGLKKCLKTAKNDPFTIFVNFFYDFLLYSDFDAKIKVCNRNLWSRWFFGMKVHYIRSVYNKYHFEILSKSSFEKKSLTADILCMVISNIA